jgi:hypothetical protein
VLENGGKSKHLTFALLLVLMIFCRVRDIEKKIESSDQKVKDIHDDWRGNIMPPFCSHSLIIMSLPS